MIDTEKRAFGAWWLWVLLLVIVTGVVAMGLRVAGVATERVIFENSYQKSAGDTARLNTMRAELVAIEARLRSGNLDEVQRSDLEAQAAGVRFQLNSQGE